MDKRNLIGKQFGKWTVLRKPVVLCRSKSGCFLSQWIVRCTCGQERTVREANLLSGHSTSCGKAPCTNKTLARDLTGKKFGRLIVIKRVENSTTDPHSQWQVQCDCGRISVVGSSNLTKGNTKSCGCLYQENLERLHEIRKQPRGHATRHCLFLYYKQMAAKRSLLWALSESEFNILTEQSCHYCGISPSNLRKAYGGANGDYLYSGIDRMDNAQGYLKENCVPCCKDCNRAKRDMLYVKFIAYLQRIEKFWHKTATKTNVEGT
jgi:hypothetical protein